MSIENHITLRIPTDIMADQANWEPADSQSPIVLFMQGIIEVTLLGTILSHGTVMYKSDICEYYIEVHYKNNIENLYEQ